MFNTNEREIWHVPHLLEHIKVPNGSRESGGATPWPETGTGSSEDDDE